ncbi:MAG: hypothetical protein M1511_15940 [Deltaproteobacteria bacterium]|nr:hypothetical protein [Deltaproteobacteria bacterium]
MKELEIEANGNLTNSVDTPDISRSNEELGNCYKPASKCPTKESFVHVIDCTSNEDFGYKRLDNQHWASSSHEKYVQLIDKIKQIGFRTFDFRIFTENDDLLTHSRQDMQRLLGTDSEDATDVIVVITLEIPIRKEPYGIDIYERSQPWFSYRREDKNQLLEIMSELGFMVVHPVNWGGYFSYVPDLDFYMSHLDEHLGEHPRSVIKYSNVKAN